MYECIQVAENTYYIASPVNMGIYAESDGVWLIDSGIDHRVGKKIAKVLQEKNWKLKAVINTHSHADHIGANAWLQKEFNVPIYGNGIERLFIENTFLAPMALWGGYPPKMLQNHIFQAQPSKVEQIEAEKLPQGFEIIPLYGHGLSMFALRTPDNIVFTADEVCSPYIFEKYGIAFNYYVEGYYSSLADLEKIEAKLFVPAHGEPFTDVKGHVQKNREAVLRTKELILDFCREACCFDVLVQKIFNRYGLNLTAAQYAIIGSTIRSYLSWLHDTGEVEVVTENNMLLWRAKSKGE